MQYQAMVSNEVGRHPGSEAKAISRVPSTGTAFRLVDRLALACHCWFQATLRHWIASSLLPGPHDTVVPNWPGKNLLFSLFSSWDAVVVSLELPFAGYSLQVANIQISVLADDDWCRNEVRARCSTHRCPPKGTCALVDVPYRC